MKELYPEPLKNIFTLIGIAVAVLVGVTFVILILAWIVSIVRAQHFRENLKPGDLVRIDEGSDEGLYVVKHVTPKKVNGIIKVYLVIFDDQYKIGDHFRRSTDITCDINVLKPY